jgi:hypothetical protein
LNAARESHTHAAGDFSTASTGSHDIEAQRILHLLEDHHLQLAKALATTSSISDEDKSNEKDDAKSSDQATASPKQPSLSSSIRRPPRRELSSSIASNLATARGKPTNTRRPVTSTSEVSSQRPSRHSNQQYPPDLPPPLPNTTRATARPTPNQNDGNFNSFLTSFETFFSKLSAPLAFTGLPLISDAPEEPEPLTPQQQPSSKPSRRTPRNQATRATTNPDLSTIFSAPALRALKEDAGALVQESFYVVQPSYAGISRTQSDMDGSDGEFVDARETLTGSQSPQLARGSQKRGKQPKMLAAVSANGKTLEELELENVALRDLLDRQSRRLEMWEASSQQQSMALHKSTMLSASNRPVVPESERVKQLEELVTAERIERETLDRQNIKLQKENERLLVVNGRYKDKWTQLKENARQRDKKRKEDDRRASVATSEIVSSPPAP